ncbi:peptidase U32 family protein [Lederbergia wuyishanensis]|uniref:Collagenase-like PrtC family protease n=1 Tax=Lederbergia wuyishanensis TaxID=1347903 RepID=A0ABU0D815_9BACI|nr:peptidase U32 family protein [Lederbergia wuyishanensis]MCJ8009300.1 U32 family peptidase [Lederbergia wuyishanensis]MDQ0344566.1 collagenase-like PrtC family protease [Lederbergia wuyishanensis]
MVEIIATAESVNQAKLLLNAGVDTLYIGEDEFGLRLPTSFTQNEIKEIVKFTHTHDKKICVAVNAIMHNDRIEKIVPYLDFLHNIGIDSITVGDPGVVHLLKLHNINIPYVYDAQTLVTSARQINFWVKRGAIGAVLARELTFEEIKAIREQVTIPMELLVYGATCIHHSKRNLVENYFNFTNQKKEETKGLFISELKKPDSHYSIFEDVNGTHVFATDDINLFPYLDSIHKAGLTQWKLDGLFTRGQHFVDIAQLFVEAKQVLEGGKWTQEKMESLNEKLIALHPEERSLNEGFFLKDPEEVK